ncbi:hypothetical protein WA026_012506 [Henosepilachna vigintioctopunctata]|uniref:Uncharacterized protein n=1 Tax=Henosepilachna vigintioctopunctata TaxID=420089 RepID=A0AAW1V0M5_9CUCU
MATWTTRVIGGRPEGSELNTPIGDCVLIFSEAMDFTTMERTEGSGLASGIMALGRTMTFSGSFPSAFSKAPFTGGFAAPFAVPLGGAGLEDVLEVFLVAVLEEDFVAAAGFDAFDVDFAAAVAALAHGAAALVPEFFSAGLELDVALADALSAALGVDAGVFGERAAVADACFFSSSSFPLKVSFSGD